MRISSAELTLPEYTRIATSIDGCDVRIETYQKHPDHGEVLALAQIFDLAQIEFPVPSADIIAQGQEMFAKGTPEGQEVSEIGMMVYKGVDGSAAITRLFAPWRTPDDPVGPGPVIGDIAYLQGPRVRGGMMFVGPDALSTTAQLSSDIMDYRADFCLPLG